MVPRGWNFMTGDLCREKPGGESLSAEYGLQMERNTTQFE